jgi:uncharacterized membrane protein
MMKKMVRGKIFISLLILISLFSITSFLVMAESPPIINDVYQESSQNDCLYYFSSNNCESCLEINKYLNQLSLKHPNIEVKKLDVYLNQEAATELNDFFEAYDVPKSARGIPAVFMQGSYLIGKGPITNLLEGRIKENTLESCPSLSQKGTIGVVSNSKASEEVLDTLSFFTITGDALKDSLNPGMIAVFLIMFALLSYIKDDDLLVRQGALFAGVVFLIHLISNISGISGFGEEAYNLFYKIVGFIVVVLSLIRIKGFLSTWKSFLKTISDNTKARAKKVREFLISTTGLLIISAIVTFFAISKTSGTFQLLQSLFQNGGYGTYIFPLVLYYNFIIILPLIILIVLFYVAHNKVEDEAEKNAKSESKIKVWRKHYHKLLNFGASIVMMIIGLILLFV